MSQRCSTAQVLAGGNTRWNANGNLACDMSASQICHPFAERGYSCAGHSSLCPPSCDGSDARRNTWAPSNIESPVDLYPTYGAAVDAGHDSLQCYEFCASKTPAGAFVGGLAVDGNTSFLSPPRVLWPAGPGQQFLDFHNNCEQGVSIDSCNSTRHDWIEFALTHKDYQHNPQFSSPGPCPSMSGSN